MKKKSLSITQRLDIYASVHKGLRSMMMDTLGAVGCMDVSDASELHAMCERVLALGDACTSHLEHENDFVHAAMEARRPGSTAQMAAEHGEHLNWIAELRDLVSRLRIAASGPAREQAAQALYGKLALFVAENFVHMYAEEIEHNQVLWACYSDADLQALEGRIVASMPPTENLMFMRWMVPAMAPAERTALLCCIQATAPAPALAAVLDAVQPHLSQRDWGQLITALVSVEVPAPV